MAQITQPYTFTTRVDYGQGSSNYAKGSELTWEELDETLIFLSGSIAGVPTSIAEVIVGTSASLVLSSSGNITGSIQEGTVWVVAGDSTPSNDGLSWIFDSGLPSPGSGSWYPFQLQIPLPYVRIFSSSRQNITSSLLISGSGVTFSSSLFWSGSSQAAADSTAYTVILSSSGQLYVTGAYGGGGGGSTALGFKTDTNTSYQLVGTDNNKVVRLLNNAGNITVGITASNFASGDQVIVMQSGSGQCVFTAGPGTTIFSANSMLKTRTQYSAATLIFSGSAHCYLFGDIAP